MIQKLYKYIITGSLFLLTTVEVYAQLAPIDTDRPDQTESAATVPKKYLQFELGFARQADHQIKAKTFQHPSLLSKYGVSKRFELRLITESETVRERNIDGPHSYTGIASVQLGGKLNFIKEKGWLPKTSLIAHYDFGTLRTPYRDSINGANFRFTMQHTLSDKYSLGYNLGMEWASFTTNNPAYIYTLTLGWNISEAWYIYLEVFGDLYQHYAPEHAADAGVAYNINNNFKVDLSAGKGLNRHSFSNYLAVGASYRFYTGK